ncbi:hypothetical protein C1N83_27895 (plasmid) [Priestia aryabhattai]
MYTENSSSKGINPNELVKMVQDFWNLFKKDYDEDDVKVYSQLTYRILHEMNYWIENNSINNALVCKKLLDLNMNENYSDNYKEDVLRMLEDELAASLQGSEFEETLRQVAASKLED